MGLPLRRDEQGHEELELLSSGQVASFITHPGTGRVLCVGGGETEEIQRVLQDAHYQVGRLSYRDRAESVATAAATFLPDVIYAEVGEGDEAAIRALEALTVDRRTDGVPIIAVIPQDASEALIDAVYSRSGCDFLRAGATRTELLARTHLVCRFARPNSLLVPTPELGQMLARPMAQAANDPAPREAFSDPATGLYTATYFEHRTPMEIARARRYGRPLTVVAIRCPDAGSDEAKAVAVAALLRRALRGPDVAARVEADLFAALLPEAEVADIDNLVARLAEGLAEIGPFGLGRAGLDAASEQAGFSPGEMVAVARQEADAGLRGHA